MNPSHASLKEAHGRHAGRRRPFRPLRRPVHRRNPDARHPRAGGGLPPHRAGHRSFQKELSRLLRDFAGRPTPLFLAERLTAQAGGAAIYLKREDLAHTGAHKINNTVGQALLARHMGKRKLIAETGAGQHGVATATTAALFGMECRIFMGVEDIRRQAPNVQRMQLLGAEVVPVASAAPAP